MPDLTGSGDHVQHVVAYEGLTKLYEKALQQNVSDLSFYFYAILIIQLLVIILGAASTAVVAVQNAGNEKWVKPLAISLTLLLTIVSSLQSSFRLKENADSLVQLQKNMSDEALQIGLEMKNAQDPSKAHDAVSERLKKYNEFVDQRLRIRGNVGPDTSNVERKEK